MTMRADEGGGWPFGAGEMTGRVRAHDWSATSLGPLESWPQSLKTAVQTALSSPFPQVVLWGPDLTQVYNDAYRDLMGVKHPAGLGQPTRDCWPEVWHLNEPIYRRVWQGESVALEDALFPVTRSGAPEDAWFPLSYSPLYDESGAVAGVLVAVFETTARARAAAERRGVGDLTRALVAHLPGGAAFVVTADGPGAAGDLRYRLAEGEALGAAGFAPADLVGKTVAEGVGPELAALYEPLYRAALERGEPFAHEHDSHGRSYVSRGTPLRDESGRVYAVLAVSYDITERRRAEEALRVSEERYRTLFNEMDEGVALCELVRDADGRAVDYRYLDLNPALVRHAAITPDALRGRRATEAFPDLDPWLIETYARVVEGRESVLTEHYYPHVGRWLRINAFPRGGDRFAVLYSDVTERKRSEAALQESEERQAFLLQLSDALRAEPDAGAVAARALRMLSRQLGLDRCWVSEVFEQQGISTVGPEHLRPDIPDLPDLPPMSGVFRLSDYPETMRQLATEPMLVRDAAGDPRFSDSEKALLAGLRLRALLVAPLRKGERAVVWALAAAMATPREWTEGEGTLLEQAAERTWAAVERARAEEALRASEEKHRTLFETMGQGYVECELVRGPDGRATDYRFVEANPAFGRLTGVPAADARGRTVRELFPGIQDWWVETYERIVGAGVPERIEYEAAPIGRWYEAYIYPQGGDRFVALYEEVTERKRAEAALKESEERQAFLLKLSDILQRLAEPNDMKAAATRALGEHLGVSRAQYHECDSSGEFYSADGIGYANGLPLLDLRYRIGDFGSFVHEDFAAGRPFRSDDLTLDPRPTAEERDAYAFYQIRAGAGFPLIRGGRLVAILAVHDVRPHPWTDLEMELIRETAERIWAAVERARAEAAVRESEERQAFLLRLSDTLRSTPNAIETEKAVAARALDFFGSDRCYYCTIEEGSAVIRRDAFRDGLRSIAGTYSLDRFDPFNVVLGTGLPFVVDDVHTSELVNEALLSLVLRVDIRSFLNVPVVKAGKVVGVFTVAQSEPRAWTEGEVATAAETAERTWAAVERARAEKALRNSEERLQRALSIETVGVLFFRLDGSVQGANDALVRMAGYTREEFLGGLDWNALTPPEFADATEKAARELAATGETAPYEKQWVREDGSRFWGLFAPTRISGEGENSHCVEFIIDITERKRAEAELRSSAEALRASEERFRTLSDAVPQVIWTNEAGGEATYFNRRWYEYTGLSYEESAGPGWQAVVHPDDAPSSQREWRRCLASGRTFDAEYRLRGADGSYRWFLGRNVPLRNGRGDITGWFGSATDIHELRELQAGLEARVAERTTELREALTALEASLSERQELVARLVTAQEEERRRISRELHDEMGQLLTGFSLGLRSLEGTVAQACPADSEAGRMLARLRSLALDMGKEVHRIAVELRPTALDDVGLAPALEAYVGEWRQRTGVPAEFAAIGLDGDRLPSLVETTAYRVVQEALNNAAKYAVTGGATRISVTLQRRGDVLLATVEDDGPGFDPEEAVRRGRLGLAGMRERAELAGGSLEIETAPGEGATIYLRLPLR